jgi:nucleotide-binding universal stress UspA family protein
VLFVNNLNDGGHSLKGKVFQYLEIYNFQNNIMENVLILTDFSKSSESAAEAGIVLSGKLNANILLFNAYVTGSSQSYIGKPWIAEDLIWGDDESKDNLNKLAAHLKPFVNQLNTENPKPVIHCNSGEGNLGSIVSDIINHEKGIELIIMGARTASNDDNDFFGSDLNSVIQKASRPILVIPPETDLKQLSKVIFATNFDEADMRAVHYLIKLGKLFNFQLEIIHVIQPGRKEITKSQKELVFEEQLARLSYPGITYKDIKGKDVAENIINLYNETQADLLAMVHHQHSFFMRMLHTSTTKKVLYNQQVPLLIFPSKMD